MKIHSHPLKDFEVIAVVGDINDDNCGELKAAVQQSIDKGQRHFLLDFSKAPFATSFAIGIIIQLWKAVGERGGALYLAGGAQFRRNLEHLNLHRVLRLFESEADFVEAVETGGRETVEINVQDKGPFKMVQIKKVVNVVIDVQSMLRQLGALIDGGCRHLALDISPLDYLDSQFIGMFVSLAGKLKTLEGELCLLGLSQDQFDTIRQLDLPKIIRVFRRGEKFPPP